MASGRRPPSCPGTLTPLPDGVQSRDAAVMGGAGLTALSVVREVARVTPEDRVLVSAPREGWER
jgi:NADPH:quinone reductase-like Zn-dependent oxidoreductase